MKTMNALGTILVTALLLTGPLSAQQPPAQQPAPKAPAAAQDGFVAVDSPIAPEDAMPAPRLVAIAYGFIWLVFFGYLPSLRTRLSTVEKEIAAVRARTRS